MKFLLASLLSLALTQAQVSAKWMFYNPYDGPASEISSGSPLPRLAPINRAGVPTGYQHVGIHYWFEDDRGRAYSEAQASALAVRFRLHIRGNVQAFISVWDQQRQLTRQEGRFTGIQLDPGVEWISPETVEFSETGDPRRLVIVFGRSQTEQARDLADSRRRLAELTARTSRDGRLEIIREGDGLTVGQIGNYVVSREGSPLAAEIVLRRQSER